MTIPNGLREMALLPEMGGRDHDLLMDTAYLVEAAEAALGYLKNAKIDLETGAPKATAIRTISGGIAKLEAAFALARESAQ